jgi:hypothetical protein
MSGMKSINIEVLMGHSIGISDSYYKITEDELLKEYLKALDFLIINSKNQLQKEVEGIKIQNQKETKLLEEKLVRRERDIEILQIQDKNNIDAIAALADKIQELRLEMELIKKKS